MAITNKTRKMLWGCAANRCSICKCELVINAIGKDDKAVIGEECHIVARELKGSRGESPLPSNERDDYKNLILLCCNHHKEIDDQPTTYPVERLHTIKEKHESWVRSNLSKQHKEPKQFFIFRVDCGRQLCNSTVSSDAFHFDNEQPKTEEEAEIIADFAQSVHDYLDIWSDLSSRDKVNAQFYLDQQLRQINACGFLVYAAQQKEHWRSSALPEPFTLDVGYMFIIGKTNSLAKRKDEQIEQLMMLGEQSESEFTNFIPVIQSPSSIKLV
jgi:hypothetical protein